MAINCRNHDVSNGIVIVFTFTAAQAAQKIPYETNELLDRFTAAQAAQKAKEII